MQNVITYGKWRICRVRKAEANSGSESAIQVSHAVKGDEKE